MDFQLEHNSNLPNIESYDFGAIVVDGQTYQQPILLHQTIQLLPENWQANQLSLNDIQAAINAKAEIIIIGTGQQHQFLSPKLIAQAAQQGIGIESMTTPSACRTVMLLQSEQRKVWAWLTV